VVGIALLVLLLFASGCTTSQLNVKNALNADRRLHGRHSLPTHITLNRKAQRWAEYLARNNRLVHSSLTSGVPSCWRSLGENVGYGSSVGAVQRLYMRSATHRANVLATKWKYVGVGAARRGSRWFTVQVFMQGC
jgi:uncharacterized protein YkwD